MESSHNGIVKLNLRYYMKKIERIEENIDQVDMPSIKEMQEALTALYEFEGITNKIYEEYKRNEIIRNRQI